MRTVTTSVALINCPDVTLAPGVKPAPAIATVPIPDTPCVAARVMLGVAKTVSIVDAGCPDASVIVMFSA